MKIYCDLTTEPGCVGILPNPGTELVLTGTETHWEPENLRSFSLAVRLAECCDLHFWFGKAPEVPFYTVPKSVVFAHDSRGGYFLAAEQPALDWSESIYYIDEQRNCYRLTPVGNSLADMGMAWRERMIPSEEIEIFQDRPAAEEKYPIRTLQQLMEAEK